MAVQTLKLAGKKFVVVPEKDYRDLKAKAARSPRKPRRVSAQDKGDVAESLRRMAEPGGKTLAEVRQKLGI